MRFTELSGAERGASILMVALALPALLLIVALVLLAGHAGLVRTELRAAADAAAHAGATVLCSTRECFKSARDTAAWTIAQHIAHSRPGASPRLEFGYHPEDTVSFWRTDSLEVRIERGRWSTEYGFRSLEGWDRADSSEYQPGMVGYVTSNAVRVTLRRLGISAVAGGVLGAESETAVSATAVNDTPQQVCIAPFAIPLCAVLNSNGNYDPDKIDNNTRYFTAVERHCRSDLGHDRYCNNLPAFPIEPTTESDILREYLPVQPVPDVPAQFTMINKMRVFLDKRPGFNTDRYTSNPFDNYGVVGLPGPYGTELTESTIRVKLATGGEQGCTVAHVGQNFQVLRDGLREARTNTVVWNRITGATYGGSDEPADAHPPFWQTDLGERRKLGTVSGPDDPTGWGIQHNSYFGDCRAQGITADGSAPANPWSFCAAPHPVQPNGNPALDEGYSTHALSNSWYVPVQNDIDTPRPNNGGLCNSTRLLESLQQFPAPADFDLAQSYSDAWQSWYRALANVDITGGVRTPGSGSPEMMQVITDLNMALMPVWQIEVPIIAAQGPGGTFCQGTAPGSTGDSPVPADEEPVNPDLPWEIVGFVEVNFYDTDIGLTPPAPPASLPNPLPPGSHPFSFDQPCNLVRGKVNGKVRTFRAGPLSEPRRTLLVE